MLVSAYSFRNVLRCACFPRNINKTIESLQNAQKNTPEHTHGPLKRRIQQLHERYLAIAANGIDGTAENFLKMLLEAWS
jgi:hypothetical protein